MKRLTATKRNNLISTSFEQERRGILVKTAHKGVDIGILEILLWAVVTLFGWLLGGAVGIGTLISTFVAGAVMHLFYSVIHFEPRMLKHKSLAETVKLLSGQ